MTGDAVVDRRSVLRGAAGAAALAGVGAALPTEARAARPDDGLVPVTMAMHVHAAFSEGSASMQAHLSEAERTGVDVIWWTEHDHRMVARRYVSRVNFDGLTESVGSTSVTWKSGYDGDLASSSAIVVSSPTSPVDGGAHALQLSARGGLGGMGTRTATAVVRDLRLTTSLDGTTLSYEVHPQDVGVDAWSDLVVETSYRPAIGGRPAGRYRVRYRVGGTRPAGTVTTTDPLSALVVVDAPPDVWTSVTVDPVADLLAVWPDVEFRDAGLTGLSFSVTSRNSAKSTVVVDALRIDRIRKSPTEVLAVQRELMDHYTPLFPTVVQQQGLEVSENTPHLNWFGTPEIWPANDPANQDVAVAVARIHAAGGVASYNHPFGTSGSALTDVQRTSRRRALTSTLVSERCFAADVIEVGYSGGRAGMTQSDYIAVWDVLSRNLVFATGVGVTDDHDGEDWLAQKWRHVTGVWATGTDQVALQAALASGRAWFADPSVFTGTLDLLAASVVPMGSVAVVVGERATLDVFVSGLPEGWKVGLISGAADEVGTNRLDPEVTSRTFGASDLVDGVLSLKVATTVSRFHRVVLRDGAGGVRAYSNPVWLLRGEPTATVPERRRVWLG